MEENEKDLLSFNWEGDSTEFFPTAPLEGDVKKKEIKEDVVEDTSKKTTTSTEDVKETEPEEESVAFFEEEAEEEDTVKPKAKKAKEETPEEGSYWGDVYKDFKDNNLLRHVEIEEEEEITSERLLELQEEDYNIEVQNRLKSWAETDLDEDAKLFIKHKLSGGKTSEFFNTVNTSGLPEGNIEDEVYQDALISYQLEKEGWDKDEIQDRIEYLTEGGKKEKFAAKFDTKIKAEIAANKANLLVSQETKNKQLKLQAEEYKSNIENTLKDVKDINGFTISPKRHASILNSLTKRTVKTSSGDLITPMQQKLADVFKDPEKTILLTELIETDFDFTPFTKKVKSKTTRSIRKKLGHQSNTRTASSSSSSNGALADLF